MTPIAVAGDRQNMPCESSGVESAWNIIGATNCERLVAGLKPRWNWLKVLCHVRPRHQMPAVNRLKGGPVTWNSNHVRSDPVPDSLADKNDKQRNSDMLRYF